MYLSFNCHFHSVRKLEMKPQCILTGVKRKRDTSPTMKRDTTSSDKNIISSFNTNSTLENCRNWVNISQDMHQKSMIKSSEKDPFKLLTSAESIDEQHCNMPSEIGRVKVTTSSTRCKGKRFWVKEQKYDLLCEWKNCDHISNDVYLYVRHVSNHIPDLDVQVNEEDEGKKLIQFI